MSEADFWERLRASTPARIGLGRSGDAVPTAVLLDLGAAHAAARDAVHRPLGTEELVANLDDIGFGPASVVASAAGDRATYLTRPDLGRRPAEGTRLPRSQEPVDLAVVVADGLSAQAIESHAVGFLAALRMVLPTSLRIAPAVVATNARVALGDHLGAALGASMVVVLIGERPGLSASDSLGVYLTWSPAPGVVDSARNCVSNIRPPVGLDYDTAARTVASLIAGARAIGATGIRLKESVAIQTST